MTRRPPQEPSPGFQKSAQEQPVDVAEFVDLDTGRMLVSSLHLVSLKGTNLKRSTQMTLREAMIQTASWWQTTGRHAMPDKRKADDYMNAYGVASGILNGYDWDRLTKQEKLRVLRAWWLSIGVPMFVGDLGTSQDGQKGVIN